MFGDGAEDPTPRGRLTGPDYERHLLPLRWDGSGPTVIGWAWGLQGTGAQGSRGCEWGQGPETQRRGRG